LIVVQARVTDVYNLYRRRKSMSLAASMQWDLLPPLTIQARRVAAAGMLEPAYEVGGDCFDYALNGPHFDLAIMDAMGHGVRSSVTAALAVGCYRHDRREGRSLEHAHRNLDDVIASQFGGEAHVTGQLARLELDTGNLTWVNAGHPLPLLVRAGRVIGHLECAPALPWGLGPSDARVASAALQPGDSVLFYTDGVVEARGSGQADFGTDRLADLAGQHASDQLSVTVIVRLLIQAVLEHHQHQLRDDATILIVQWSPSELT
jgi:serine phosphatase RsbU (regulator of sigma subunit)